MNLQSEISPELWDVVIKSYEAVNYTHAINDSIRYLFDVIRDKSGVEDDGAGLIGQAFGGNIPKLQLNKLQTESEKSEQKGFQEILRGIYSGIRNPRSHERRTDSQETADAIIVFVNYLLGVINQAKEPFTVEGWIERVYDPYFVQNKEYAEALVEDIPVRKRFETLVALYHKREIDKTEASCFIFSAFYSILGEAQIKEWLRIVSSELRLIQDKNDIKFHFLILRPEFWSNIDKAARLRIEGLILKEIQQGTYELEEHFDNSIGFYVDYSCTRGWLATWAIDYIPYFLNKEQVHHALREKAGNEFVESRNYFAQFFLHALPNIFPEYRKYYVVLICHRVIADQGEGFLTDRLTTGFYNFPSEWAEDIEETLKKKDSEIYKKVIGEMIPF